MKNQKMLEFLFAEPESENDLYHHGVDGQKWGVQNGPPYPLSGENKKIAKAQYKEYKKQKKEEQKQADVEKKRNKIIKNADVDAMRKHKDWFSQQEIDAIIKKHQTLKSAENMKKAETKPPKSSRTSRSKKKALEEADLDYIKKHPDEFTTEEMMYAQQRRKVLDAQHQKSKTQVKKEHDLEDTYAKIQKAAAIAASATTILTLAKTGMEVAKSFKDFSAKDTKDADARFKEQFNHLKGIDKSMALDAFNKYYKTDYSLADIPMKDNNNGSQKNKNDTKKNANKSADNSSGKKKNNANSTIKKGQNYVIKLSSETNKPWHVADVSKQQAEYDYLYNRGFDFYHDWKYKHPDWKLTR